LIAEGEAVARRLGIELPRRRQATRPERRERAPENIAPACSKTFLAKRQTEVDFMNGAIAQWATKSECPLRSTKRCGD